MPREGSHMIEVSLRSPRRIIAPRLRLTPRAARGQPPQDAARRAGVSARPRRYFRPLNRSSIVFFDERAKSQIVRLVTGESSRTKAIASALSTTFACPPCVDEGRQEDRQCLVVLWQVMKAEFRFCFIILFPIIASFPAWVRNGACRPSGCLK